MGYFPVRYDSRVVIYERKMFIRLATEVPRGKISESSQTVHGNNKRNRHTEKKSMLIVKQKYSTEKK